MTCGKCNNKLIYFKGNLKVQSISYSYNISNVYYYECENCGEILLPNKTWIKMDETEDKLDKKSD